MQTIEEFSCSHVEEENNNVIKENVVDLDAIMKQKIVDHVIIQFSNNCSPKGLVPLEKLFDQNDVARSSLPNDQHENLQDCNIGTTE